jgi:hypothetical protein
MLLFPSWLQHTVHPFAGDGERISIAFNVLIDALPNERTGAGGAEENEVRS